MNETALRRLTAAWPGVEAGMKWDDDLVFTVAGKMFCVTCVRGPHQGSISFKVEDERFLEFTGRPGFIPAPYLARALGADRLGKAAPRGRTARVGPSQLRTGARETAEEGPA